MQLMSNKLVITLILLVLSFLIGLGVYNFYQTHEYKEVTKRTGFIGEARKNPLYATRLFLKRMGIPSETRESVQGLNGFPDTDTVLLINTNRTTLSNTRTLEMIDWVKSGGHIIAKTTKDWKYNGSEKTRKIKKSRKHSPDPLQRYLGVRTGSRTFFSEPDNEVDALIDGFLNESIQETNKENEKKIETISLNGVDKNLALDAFRYRTILLDKDKTNITEKVVLDHNTFMVRQKIGKGLVTLVASMSFIENKQIENADHAEILWQLVHGLHKPINQPKSVWLIHNDEVPSLWDILWGNAWAFILSLGLLLGAWLLANSNRFGPMIPKQLENRRSLNEHITSSGNFYWKANKKQKLIASSRKALLRRLARIHPGWEQRSQKEQIQLLADSVKMTPESLNSIIYSDINNPAFEQAENFTQLIQDIEKIRNQI